MNTNKPTEIETLRTGYAAARLEIESLKAQLHAAKQINTAQFWLLTSSIPGSALRASRWQAPAGAAPTTQPAPQQEAQEPVARLEIGKTKGGVSLTHIAEPAAFQLPEGMYALYTTPQPSPAAQVDIPDVVDAPDQCPYFGPSPHRDVWLAGWYAARAAQEGK